MQAQIRPSTEKDVPAITNIYAHYVHTSTATYELEPPTPKEMSARRSKILALGLPYLVAEQENKIVGYAYAGQYRPRPGYQFTIEDSVYIHPEHQGQGLGQSLLSGLIEICEDAGARIVKQYVWVAESDDYADQHLLERLVAVLDGDSAIAFAYCRSRAVMEDGQVKGFVDSYLEDLDGQRWKADYIGDGDEECRNYFVACNIVPNASAVVFRKGIYDSVGGTDETLRACGDWKVWADMAHTRKVAYICEPLNYYRSHGATVRSKSTLHVPEILDLVRDLLERFKPQENVLEQVCKMQAERWVPAVVSAYVRSERRWQC